MTLDVSDDKITDEQLTEAAAAPQMVSADGVTMQSRPLGDLIALQKHQAKTNAAKRPGRGIGFIKLIPEGNS